MEEGVSARRLADLAASAVARCLFRSLRYPVLAALVSQSTGHVPHAPPMFSDLTHHFSSAVGCRGARRPYELNVI